MNSIIMGLTVALCIPAAKEFFADKDPSGTTVQMGFAGANKTLIAQGKTPYYANADVPRVTLYDDMGRTVGNSADNMEVKDPGMTYTRRIKGNFTAEYIKITAYGPEPVCIDYVTVTSWSGDLRNWNAGTAEFCGVPTFENSRIHPGTDIRFPCVWLSAAPELYPSRGAVSWKLTDFSPTSTPKGQAMAEQWSGNPPTLCRAPARQQFWTQTTHDSCVPYYRRALEHTPEGADKDLQYVMNGNVQTCKDAGTPDNGVSLYTEEGAKSLKEEDALRVVHASEPYTTDPRHPEQGKAPPIPAGTELHSTLQLGPLVGRRSDGRVYPRAARPELEKCLHELVVSHLPTNSARRVCKNPMSWGPDFVSVHEGMYCDMCERELYKVCTSKHQSQCFDLAKRTLRMPRRLKREPGVVYPEEKTYKVYDRWA
jgi:hypothetical protein